ncbi:unnamed protein product [Durusdinium trenchii]|uniref:PDZ domain-containing protein n=1 Tax=Durusdinium trenchii TaxID=1381693 RepID=A0ABP0K4E3_9DINO
MERSSLALEVLMARRPESEALQPGTLPSDPYNHGHFKKWDFQVVLLRESQEKKFGIKYVSQQDGRLKVAEISKGGLCAEHNAQVGSFLPESMCFLKQVLCGDFILSVNGVSGDVEQMKQKLITSLTVHLTLQPEYIV